MYSWYKRVNENGRLHFVWEEQTSLAGCNNGIIANELRDIIKVGENPPIGWSIPIAEKWNREDYSFVIDIKPSTDEVFLCELDRVFGYTFDSWTPIMLQLRVLYNNMRKENLDKIKTNSFAPLIRRLFTLCSTCTAASGMVDSWVPGPHPMAPLPHCFSGQRR